MSDRLTIGREAYLTSGREFAHVREHGEKVVGRFMVLGWLPAPDASVRLGLIVSRRYDRRAVQRNRARRLLRESYRLLRGRIERPLWLVAIARERIRGRSQAEVQQEMERLLRRLDALAPQADSRP